MQPQVRGLSAQRRVTDLSGAEPGYKATVHRQGSPIDEARVVAVQEDES
jgi:hypothetical protein